MGNMLSYLLEYGIIFIGICCHIYWNISPYLLKYVNIFIGICYIYLLEYAIISIGIGHHIYLLLNSNSDKKLHPKHYKRKISLRNIYKQQQKH